MGKKKEYVIASVILVLGCAISAFILLTPPKSKTESKPPTDNTQEGTVLDTNETEATFTIEFYDENASLIENMSVTEGSPLLPPKYSKEGYVFKGWDKFLFYVASDMKAHPIIEPLKEDKNIVYADAVYTNSNRPLTVSAMLGGEVDCCDFVIEVGYDSELLSFSNIGNAMPGLDAEDKKDEGKLVLTYSGDTVNEKTLLADIKFDVITDGLYSSKLVFATKEIHKKSDDGTVEYTDSTAYETNIFILNKEENEK